MIKKSVFTIVEVAEMLDVNVSKVRYYIDQFNVRVPKRANKYAFTEKEIKKVRKIMQLIDEEGYTLDGAKVSLRSHEDENAYLNSVLERLNNVKTILDTLRDKLPT